MSLLDGRVERMKRGGRKRDGDSRGRKRGGGLCTACRVVD
jgi:hypothetical protein